MDELKPLKQNKRTLKLTDEQKADIRNEMNKCATEEEAKEHRRLLAEYYGVTIPQIVGVAAYKQRPDGGFDLKPQFKKK